MVQRRFQFLGGLLASSVLLLGIVTLFRDKSSRSDYVRSQRRAQALQLVRYLNPEPSRILPHVSKAFTDHDPRVHEAAMEALIAVGEPAVETAIRFLSHPDPDVQHRALRVLASIPHRRRIPGDVFLPFLNHPKPVVRALAIRCFQPVRPVDLERLYELAADDVPIIRNAAVEQIVRWGIHSPKFDALLQKHLEMADTRAEFTQALCQLITGSMDVDRALSTTVSKFIEDPELLSERRVLIALERFPDERLLVEIVKRRERPAATSPSTTEDPHVVESTNIDTVESKLRSRARLERLGNSRQPERVRLVSPTESTTAQQPPTQDLPSLIAALRQSYDTFYTPIDVIHNLGSFGSAAEEAIPMLAVIVRDSNHRDGQLAAAQAIVQIAPIPSAVLSIELTSPYGGNQHAALRAISECNLSLSELPVRLIDAFDELDRTNVALAHEIFARAVQRRLAQGGGDVFHMPIVYFLYESRAILRTTSIAQLPANAFRIALQGRRAIHEAFSIATLAAAKYAGPLAAPVANAFLSDRDRLVRIHALCTLHDIGPTTLPTIRQALSDHHPSIAITLIQIAESMWSDSEPLARAILERPNMTNGRFLFHSFVRLGSRSRHLLKDLLQQLAALDFNAVGDPDSPLGIEHADALLAIEPDWDRLLRAFDAALVEGRCSAEGKIRAVTLLVDVMPTQRASELVRFIAKHAVSLTQHINGILSDAGDQIAIDGDDVPNVVREVLSHSSNESTPTYYVLNVCRRLGPRGQHLLPLLLEHLQKIRFRASDFASVLLAIEPQRDRLLEALRVSFAAHPMNRDQLPMVVNELLDLSGNDAMIPLMRFVAEHRVSPNESLREDLHRRIVPLGLHAIPIVSEFLDDSPPTNAGLVAHLLDAIHQSEDGGQNAKVNVPIDFVSSALRLLNSPDECVRLATIRLLGRVGRDCPEAVQLLTDWMVEPSNSLTTMRVVGQVSPAAASVSPSPITLNSEQSSRQEIAILEAIRQIALPVDIPASRLLPGLRHRDEEVRILTASILSTQDEATRAAATDWLIDALR